MTLNPKLTRVAWLLNSAFFYWHPSLYELSRQFPQLKIFTAWWRGYADGYEDKLSVEVVGDRKIVALQKSTESYGSNYTALSPSIVKYLFAYKPHVIFSNSFGIWTILALLFKPLGRWRLVIAYEGSSPGVDYLHSPVRLTVRRQMVRLADACITNSQAGRRYLLDTLNADPAKVFNQPYEVPNAQALAASTTEHPLDWSTLTRPVFLFVGSVDPRKGLNFLLDACGQLKARQITGFRLLVVGDGPQRAELMARCDAEGLSELVQWVGKVTYDEVGAFFRQADVFVLPTLEDTWGVVVSEAMVLGKPVLCSRQAGAVELIEDGVTGYGFDPRNSAQLAQLMEQLIKNPTARQQIGQQAQDYMAQYDPAAAGDFLARVTRYALGDRTPSPS